LVREIAYDEVFDAQKHFRSILDSIARPGKINRLGAVSLDPPPGLNAASVLAAFALLDANTTFHVAGMERGEAAYLTANTNAARADLSKAHFVFASGMDSPEFLEDVDCGTLPYPDTAATLVLQVARASASPLADSLRLTLRGPGIQAETAVFVQGLSPDLLLAIQARNAEFPLGLDTIATFVDEAGAPCVFGLPRSTKVTWEAC
jgi:alpha-D-ribose 1-methylphosphonate 5-triphosphate synthase subunit PhnH